jgi:spoIIIJ-associated protein
MSQEYIEITEKTVDDAITAACQRLSVTSNRLDYIVVQKEKAGFLGIGAKPAIIKARVKDAAEAAQAILDDVIGKAEKKVQKEILNKTAAKKEEKVSKPAAKEETKAPEAEKAAKIEKKEEAKAEKKELKEKEKEGKKNNKKNKKKSSAPRKAEAETEAAPAVSSAAPEKEAAPKKKAAIPQLTDEKIAEIKKAAHEFLEGVFKTMDMDVEISEDYQKDTGILTVNMEGEDMGVLIGKRGQTLDSLQYLVSLVVNKDLDGYIHVKADTENYRERRKKTLENLAKNIAFKVKRTRQSVALEPMNPYERRIIHSALQNEKYITTYSEGEEPYRKVVVAIKKDENGVDLLKEEKFEKGGRGRNGRGRNNRGGRRGRDFRGSRENRRGGDNASESKQDFDSSSGSEE